MPVQAVLLDFYGTLARATSWGATADSVLADHGYELPAHVRDAWWNDGLDGTEHGEHSASRDHYVAWQRERLLGMLAACDVHPGEYEVIVERLEAGRAERVLEAYPEVPAVLADLRARGLRLAVCSNWDWDLTEAMAEAGLEGTVDLLVSSAWAGARKPHPRIFEHTLERLGARPADVLFVGDTWGPDVTGPHSLGITSLYLRRDDHWDDPTAPPDAHHRAPVGRDLTAVAALVARLGDGSPAGRVP